jgi:hypothetical protein
MRSNARLLLLLLALCLPLLSACTKLECSVDKKAICRGEEVCLHWESRGYFGVELQGGGDYRQLKSDTRGEASGNVTLKPESTTTYEITATASGEQPAVRFVEVKVFPRSGSFTIVLEPQCPSQGPMQWYGEYQFDGPVPQGLHVTTVKNNSDRRIKVVRMGQIILEPFQGSFAWSGHGLEGKWVATASADQLHPGEGCPSDVQGTTGPSPTVPPPVLPPNLTVTVFYECTPP